MRSKLNEVEWLHKGQLLKKFFVQLCVGERPVKYQENKQKIPEGVGTQVAFSSFISRVPEV